MIANQPQVTTVDSATPQYSLSLFLLAYRWASLLLAMWLFLVSQDVIVPQVSLAFLLAVSVGSSLIITILYIPLRLKLLEAPVFLAVDLLLAAILLALSGATRSPYILYALSPLLASAFFFQRRGALIAATTFSLFYLVALWVANQFYPPLIVDLGLLFTQFIGACLVMLMFGSLSTALAQLRHAHKSLATAHMNLTRQNAELAATYQRLEVIYDLTLFLHAPDSPTVQQRLIKAITKEFNFARVVVGLVNPGLKRLEGWQMHPPPTHRSLLPPPLPLNCEQGPIAQAAMKRQVSWCPLEQELVPDATLNSWLGAGNWLILPMVWQEQTVGVLLVIVEKVGPVDLSDDRWAVLTSLVSQAAAALGTIDRTRRLAVEQERNRIARDIHDTVAQSLFGIVFTLDACTKLLPSHVQTVKEELIELRNVADKVRHDVRQSILDMWPSDLTHEQFKLDLDKYVASFAPPSLFKFDFTLEGDFDGLSPVIRRSLYRVCQESLANAAQHAQTDSARVYLMVDADEIFLSIRDKGHGFDPKAALAREYNREHFGLRGMQERIQSLGGSCDILSQIGHGTQVLVRLPVNGRNGHG